MEESVTQHSLQIFLIVNCMIRSTLEVEGWRNKFKLSASIMLEAWYNKVRLKWVQVGRAWYNWVCLCRVGGNEGNPARALMLEPCHNSAHSSRITTSTFHPRVATMHIEPTVQHFNAWMAPCAKSQLRGGGERSDVAWPSVCCKWRYHFPLALSLICLIFWYDWMLWSLIIQLVISSPTSIVWSIIKLVFPFWTIFPILKVKSRHQSVAWV